MAVALIQEGPVPIILVTNWFWTGPLQVLGSTLAGRVIGTRFVQSVSRCLGIFLRPQGAFPPRLLLPSGRFGLSPGAWGAPNKGNADGAVGIFGNSGRVWATALRPDPPKKGLVPYLPVRWGGQQILRSRSFWWQIDFGLDLSRYWVALWPAVSSGRGSGRVCLGAWGFPTAAGGLPPGYYSL